MTDWKTVPVEPTWEMKQAGRDTSYAQDRKMQAGLVTYRTERCAEIYAAMLNVAPSPPPPPMTDTAEQVIERATEAILDLMDKENREQNQFAGPMPRDNYRDGIRKYAIVVLEAADLRALLAENEQYKLAVFLTAAERAYDELAVRHAVSLELADLIVNARAAIAGNTNRRRKK